MVDDGFGEGTHETFTVLPDPKRPKAFPKQFWNFLETSPLP